MSGRDVMTLMNPYFDKGHKLFIDNWYMSLLEKLHEKGTNVCGTVRKNRKGLPEHFVHNLKKGETEVRHVDELLFVRWCDKREDYTLNH